MSDTRTANELIALALSTAPRGIMTDIDGTISRIAEHPDAARVIPAARDALAELAPRLDIVAAVSGRAAEDARSLVGVDRMVYAGNHGMEVWRDGRLQRSRLATEHAPRIEEMMRRLEQLIEIDGVYFENKDLTASIHVRGTENPDSSERKVMETASPLADELNLRITRGRKVIEIRPPVDLSKGTAVLDLVEEYHLRGLIFFGDDVTDVDAFKALRQRRQETGNHLYAIGVRRELTPTEVLDASDALVDDVDGVIDALTYATVFVRSA